MVKKYKYENKLMFALALIFSKHSINVHITKSFAININYSVDYRGFSVHS